MAVISRIRKHSGFLVALIGLAILGFVVQDFFGSSRRGGPPAYLAKIDGEIISYDAFSNNVEATTENFRRQQGADIALSNEDLNYIRNMVWDNMLSDLLLKASCDELGLTISRAELNDMFYGVFVHNYVYSAFANPQTGEFDRNNVIMWINDFDQRPLDAQQQFRDIEKAAKDDRLKTKYYTLVSQGYNLPSTYAKKAATLQTAATTARFLSLPYSEIADDQVTVSQADLKKYYNENKHLYKQDASRAIDYVLFEAIPTPEDMNEITSLVSEYYEEFKTEENIADFVNAVSTERYDSTFMKAEDLRAPWKTLLFESKPGTVFEPVQQANRFEMAKLIDIQSRPDSLKASHIALSYTGSMLNPNNVRSKEETKKLADSLAGVARRNINAFPELAAQFSEDQSREQGGDLGWMLDGQIIGQLNDALIKGRVGDVVVVETQIGYHVVNITGKTAPIQKVRAAFVYVPIEPSSATRKEVAAKANQFLLNNRDLASFNNAVAEQGLSKRTSEYTDQMAFQLPGISSGRDLVRWAFEKSTKVGDVSEEVFEYDNTFVVAVLREIREKGVMPFEQFKNQPQVDFTVKREKKAEQLMAKVNEAAKQATDIEKLAAVLNTKVESVENLEFAAYSLANSGYEPEVVGYLLGAAEGKLSPALKGSGGVYAVQVDHQSPGVDITAQMMSEQMKSFFQQNLGNNVRKTLTDNSNITDNRYFLY